MKNDTSNLEGKMKALREFYLSSLAGRHHDLASAMVNLEAGGGRVALEQLHHHAHKTAGSSATFGFADITSAARELEQASESFLARGGDCGEEAARELHPLLKTLLEVVDAAGKGVGISPDVEADTSLPGDRHLESFAKQSEGKTVLVISAAGAEEKDISDDLSRSGFKVALASNLDSAREEWATKGTRERGKSLTAVLVDQSPGLVPDGQDLAKIFNCPVIFLLDRDTLQDRLAAVRAGAETCFVKPAQIMDLVDALDRLALSDENEPFRILIIDDDESISRYNQVILQGAGMIAQSINDPSDILGVLERFSPEIILMDLYMPDCNGQELSSIIRQKEEFSGIPIVFLSSETDVHKQISAMSHGGDGFLTKPISPRHLIEYVLVRAKRFRMLRSLMVRDGLTGLYNHTTTKQFLENEIARAERSGEALSFVMLDIDHFKKVNDTYGHGVGDQVIKSLSRLLKLRLRSIDTIGRMGGEEFGIILSGSGADFAEEIMNDIRVAFSEITQGADGETFHTTFSCGISELLPGQSGQSLSDMADKALYAAKEGGRNRVVVLRS